MEVMLFKEVIIIMHLLLEAQELAVVAVILLVMLIQIAERLLAAGVVANPQRLL